MTEGKFRARTGFCSGLSHLAQPLGTLNEFFVRNPRHAFPCGKTKTFLFSFENR